MGMLRELLLKNGIELYLCVYPWPQQIVFDTAESRQVQYWREWAREEDVPFLEYFSAFMSAGKLEALHQYFIPGDIHWNEAGHALVARRFLEFYRRGEG
jgi:hypothetical protein